MACGVFRAGGRLGLDSLCSLRLCWHLSQRLPTSTCLITPPPCKDLGYPWLCCSKNLLWEPLLD